MSLFKKSIAILMRVLELDGGTVKYFPCVERHFGITIRREERSRIVTAGDMARLISGKLVQAGRPRAEEDIWLYVRKISAEVLRVREFDLLESTRLGNRIVR